MMPEPLSNVELIQLAEDIAMRQVIHAVRGAAILKLGMEARFSIVWRTTLHSNTSAAKVWARLESQGIEMETLMSMVGEFCLRAGPLPASFYENMAASLSWGSSSASLPDEIRTFSAKNTDYKEVLTLNPWLVFLYLLSMSDIVQRLDTVLPKNMRSGANLTTPPKGEEA